MMKRRPLIVVLIILVFPMILIGCGKEPQAVSPPPPKSWTLPVMTATIGAPVEYTTVGSVVSDQRVEVTSRLSGYIRDISVTEGDQVRRGQVLVRLDASDVEGGIRQGKAGVAAAEAAYRDAQTDLERFQRLFERGSISDNEMRKIRLRHDAARETLNQARAAFDMALAQRNYTEIKSPVAGVVVARVKRTGDLALPGAPILTIESGSGLLFETFAAEGQVAAIAIGKPVEVRIDGMERPSKGVVSRVVSSGDPVTRSYQIKIALTDTSGLKTGMFGRACFPVGKNDSPVVSRKALIERGGLQGVFVVGSDGLARFRWLRIGREWSDRVEVMAGLGAEERFVAAPDPALRDGDRITAEKAPQ